MMRIGTSIAVMAFVCLGLLSLVAVSSGSVAAAADDADAKAASEAAAKVTANEKVTEEQFLSAAFDFCATKQNRAAKSCECEQKLIVDTERVSLDDRIMAYYFWVDQKKFQTLYKAKVDADPKFKEAFGDRFRNLQALIVSACGS